MLTLLDGGKRSTPEIGYAQEGLRSAYPDEAEGVLYGCTLFEPGWDYQGFARALGNFSLRGIIGLSFSEMSMYSLAGRPDVREAYGRILQLAPPPVYVWSQLSKEWALHFSIAAEVGGHPAWLMPSVVHETIADDLWHTQNGGPKRWIAKNLGESIACALANTPFLIELPEEERRRVPSTGGWGSHPLVQFAQTYGCRDNLVLSDEERTERLKSPIEPIPRETVDRAIELARTTVQSILARGRRTTVVGALGAALDAAGIPASDTEVDELGVPIIITSVKTPPTPVGPGTKPVPSMPELVVGRPFDPQEHYTENYFGGGLRYTKPDGTKDTYYGPGHAWDGFDAVVAAMSEILLPPNSTKHIRILDIGCGYGDFIYRARRKDPRLETFGIDLSDAATRGAAPPIRPYLVVGDATNPNVLSFLAREPFDVVTTWDFWEHIYEGDNDQLAHAVHRMLRPGGLMFNIICTRGRGEADFISRKGDLVTVQNSWALVSGHVNIRSWGYWVDFFSKFGLEYRGDIGHKMLAALAGDPTMGNLPSSWSPKNLLVVGRK